MLKEQRQEIILSLVNKNKTISTNDLLKVIDTSEATIRRDLNELHKQGLLIKVYGGAKSKSKPSFITNEDDMSIKKGLNTKSKDIIGRYAGNLIEDKDFIYLDSGTSVEAMLPYIKAKDVTIVTNSVEVLNSNHISNIDVYILSGILKHSTKSIIGAEALENILNFNFTKGFFGTNGIDHDYGFTTPNNNEASIKKAAIKRSRKKYVLADSSKFGVVSQVTFSKDDTVDIITEKEGKIYIKNLKEV